MNRLGNICGAKPKVPQIFLMIIVTKDLNLPDLARPLYSQQEQYRGGLTYQQLQYELRLEGGHIVRIQSCDRLVNRAFIPRLTLNVGSLDIRLFYFTSSASVFTQPIMASEVLIEEAYTGKVNGRGLNEFWASEDVVYESQTLNLKSYSFGYSGQPFADEKAAILNEQRRRTLVSETIPEQSAPPNLTLYRPLGLASIRRLPDHVIYGVTQGTQTVEQFISACLQALVTDTEIGEYWSGGLDSYEHREIPTIDPNLEARLVEECKSIALDNLVDKTLYQPIYETTS